MGATSKGKEARGRKGERGNKKAEKERMEKGKGRGSGKEGVDMAWPDL